MTMPTLTRKAEKTEVLYVFDNSDALTDGILFLYNKKPLIKSSLYKTTTDYRLILTADCRWPTLRQLCEFAKFKTKNYIFIAITREHGKPLVLGNAVKTYGKAFFKEI
ncbi:MAG: adaptor protein MecA [Ruminococcaceae bacterium]|nr:adaptor protein MecA [Oscillospiraceae bacterium]